MFGLVGVGFLLVWFLISVLRYKAHVENDREKRKLKSQQERKKFSLETDESKEGWTYHIGKGKKFELFGTGKGRSSWIPGKDDVAPEFEFNREENANAADRVYREIMMQKNGMDEMKVKEDEKTTSEAEKAATAAVRGSVFYSRLQSEDGFWPGDYGGPMFLLPGLIFACYATNIDLGTVRKKAMLRYIMSHQQKDGGWGTHIEGISTVFGSSLNYSAARLLGLSKDDPRSVKARDFMRSEGGAVAAPQWAKFWLAIIGAYEWSGVNPTPPELWLLPYWFPYHPGRIWCHCRMVYLPMSALFGSRYVYENAENDPIILSLREELYCTKYSEINWGSFYVRECVAERDIYNPQTYLMTVANHVLHNTLENPYIRALFFFPLQYMREKSLEFVYSYIHYEDKHTNWIDIGPVNKAFNLVATYAHFGGDSKEFQNHIGRIDDYLWLAEDGLKMQGYNGSALWDTCFATHALATAVLASKQKQDQTIISENHRQIMYQSMIRASKFVDEMQVKENVEKKELYFRDNSVGGWPFSTQDHGWPISDCTAEGVKAAILLSSSKDFLNDPKLRHISQERLEQAIVIILDLQNTSTDFGWASYELNRGYEWYEWLNPAQVFGDIMIDYSYVECSSACVQALCEFATHYPNSKYYDQCMKAAQTGADFIVSKQRKDGGFYGSWAVCFTYGAWFGCEGLATVLQTVPNLTGKQKQTYKNALKLACQFLLNKQRSDGGWGEDVTACAKVDWIENETQVVQTGWALISLVKAAQYFKKDDPSFFKQLVQSSERASKLLRERQLENGDWDQECISGVFNKSCSISYTAYRNVFPIWALSRYAIFALEQE